MVTKSVSEHCRCFFQFTSLSIVIVKIDPEKMTVGIDEEHEVSISL